MTRPAVVVVGASHAGISAVRTLREDGFDGRIVLVGEERHLPYERPYLSKQLMHGATSIAQLTTLDAGWYESQGVELRLGHRAERIEPGGSAVVLADGEVLAAAAVVLATGSTCRRLPIPEHERIRYLRTYEDAIAISERLTPGARLVVVGAGLIGAEIAAAARSRDCDVTVLERAQHPFAQVLGCRVGAALAEIHRLHGVDLRAGEGVARLAPSSTAVVITTTGGARLEADLVVVGIGVVANDGLAVAAGLAVADGVLVGPGCATAAPNVYAAGDVANQFHPRFGVRLRLGHYDNALKQGTAAARSVLGRTTTRVDVPWFWSDQYGHTLQYAGYAPTYDQLVVRGSLDELTFLAYYVLAGRLVACAGVDAGGDVRLAGRLIGTDVRGVLDELVDPAIDLRSVVRAVLGRPGSCRDDLIRRGDYDGSGS